jgi:hypothetical protein
MDVPTPERENKGIARSGFKTVAWTSVHANLRSGVD